MNYPENIKFTVLFEIYKRFENGRHFPDRETDSGPKELKRIVHEVCSETAYLDHDSATEEFFFDAIKKIYDDIALKKYNPKVEEFSNKYIEYIYKQISEIKASFKYGFQVMKITIEKRESAICTAICDVPKKEELENDSNGT